MRQDAMLSELALESRASLRLRGKRASQNASGQPGRPTLAGADAFRVILADTAPGTCERLFLGLCMAGMEPSFCHDFGELLDACQKQAPGAVFMTFAFMGPDWERELADMRSMYPTIGIFLLAEHNPDCVAVVSAVQAGASGVFHCHSDLRDVVAAVKRSAHPDEKSDSRARLRALSGYDDLTRRERETLELIFRGKTNVEAAADLSISHRTVEVHRHRLMKKLGARNAADLVRMILAA